MIGLWLTTIGGFLLVLAGLGIYIYYVREGLDIENEKGIQEVKKILKK